MSGAFEPAGWGPRGTEQRLLAAACRPTSSTPCGDEAVSLPSLLSPPAALLLPPTSLGRIFLPSAYPSSLFLQCFSWKRLVFPQHSFSWSKRVTGSIASASLGHIGSPGKTLSGGFGSGHCSVQLCWVPSMGGSSPAPKHHFLASWLLQNCYCEITAISGKI